MEKSVFVSKEKRAIKSWKEEFQKNPSWMLSEINNLPRYKEELKHFYKKFKDEINSATAKSTGDRKFLIKKFIPLFEELLEKTLSKDVVVSTEAPIGEWGDGKKKKIDLLLEKDSKKVFIEIKFWCDIDKIGAALIESIVSEKNPQDKFFVVCMGAGSKNSDYRSLKNLIQKYPVNEYINGCVSFCPAYKDALGDVVQFLDTIKNHFKS